MDIPRQIGPFLFFSTVGSFRSIYFSTLQVVSGKSPPTTGHPDYVRCTAAAAPPSLDSLVRLSRLGLVHTRQTKTGAEVF